MWPDPLAKLQPMVPGENLLRDLKSAWRLESAEWASKVDHKSDKGLAISRAIVLWIPCTQLGGLIRGTWATRTYALHAQGDQKLA
ncbi:hypothetical protein CKO28_24215 [Rhodovibrio sodomensis]|uniref:Uncharacterized protein n=1 Tax=Rhodovibrio sodomensis TaxID=1088 RepID=A0ABS1DLJ6_9PROT|nr:hypothetical protein [Rhodovibrio sodomensis]